MMSEDTIPNMMSTGVSAGSVRSRSALLNALKKLALQNQPFSTDPQFSDNSTQDEINCVQSDTHSSSENNLREEGGSYYTSLAVGDNVTSLDSCDLQSEDGGVVEMQDSDPHGVKDSEDPIDESIYDYSFYEPKMQDEKSEEGESAPDYASSDILCDNWYKSDCGDKLVEEFVEVNGKFVEVSALHHSKNNEYQENKDTYLCGGKGSNVLYDWSRKVESEVERNEIYDKWMLDLVTWERNRLMWLEQQGLLEGFDYSCDKDRTFLVKVVNALPQTIYQQDAEGVNKAQETSQEDWYKSERLQCHKYLYDNNLPNWYEELLRESSSEASSNVSCANPQDPTTSGKTAGGCLPSKPHLREKDPLDSFLFEVPDDLVRVYQFTDRLLWRKYHKCFKQGKYLD